MFCGRTSFIGTHAEIMTEEPPSRQDGTPGMHSSPALKGMGISAKGIKSFLLNLPQEDIPSGMKIDVAKVAKLTNLTITPSEEVEFDQQLNDIIVYIEQLNSI